MAKTYELIAVNTISSATANFTFSSIPSTYTDLVLICNSQIAGYQNIFLRPNSDSGSNYSRTYFYATGTAQGRGTVTTNANGLYVGSGEVSPNFQVSITHIMSYANTNVNKFSISRGNIPSDSVDFTSSMWNSTAAISSLYVYPSGNTFATGSTFSLYGIKAA